MQQAILLIPGLLALSVLPRLPGQEAVGGERKVAPLETLERDGVAPLTRVGRLLLAGQPSQDALGRMTDEGATVVVDLRLPSEQRGFDEAAFVDELGLTYVNLGFGSAEALTDEIFAEVRRRLAAHRAPGAGDLVLHCASSNRVGAVWLAGRVLDEGVDWTTAFAEAQRIGLHSPALEGAVEAYVVGQGRSEFGKKLLELRAAFPKVARVDVGSLELELGGERPPILLDVRSQGEFGVSHLAGARRAETLDAALQALAGVPKDAALVAYCSVGYRSSKLAAALATEGFTNVRNLEGSIFAWANSGRPVFRGRERASRVHPYDEEWGRFLDPALRANPGK